MKYDDQHSQLVEQAALVAKARPGVIDLTLHSPSVYYTDAEGKKQRHVFDFIVELDTGRKVAVTVISKAREHEVVAVLQAVNKAGVPEVESGRLKRRLFDFARTWTELETTPD